MKSSVIQEEPAMHSELRVQGAHCINYEGGVVGSSNILFDIEPSFDSDVFFSLFILLLEQRLE